MPIKIEVKMDSESMAEFMIYHIYTGTSGILALVLGFLNVLSLIHISEPTRP